jgi:hypothetical protein
MASIDCVIVTCEHASRRALCSAAPELTLRLNYPYRGTADGFTVYLRHRFPSAAYLGIEIEVNQTHVRSGWKRLRQLLRTTLKETLWSMLPSPA